MNIVNTVGIFEDILLIYMTTLEHRGYIGQRATKSTTSTIAMQKTNATWVLITNKHALSTSNRVKKCIPKFGACSKHFSLS